ncbi:hypothetical protein V9T40_002372 [Parthenolecanium corni]|uniref:Uncharacterized protein n=1 Tax=Parthenolecanium corni TaxID=536013 RepID=A0AAN9TKD8_9HEMI
MLPIRRTIKTILSESRFVIPGSSLVSTQPNEGNERKSVFGSNYWHNQNGVSWENVGEDGQVSVHSDPHSFGVDILPSLLGALEAKNRPIQHLNCLRLRDEDVGTHRMLRAVFHLHIFNRKCVRTIYLDPNCLVSACGNRVSDPLPNAQFRPWQNLDVCIASEPK